MKQKVLEFEDGTKVPTTGNLQVMIGNSEPVEEHDVSEIPEQDFQKVIEDPEHFEVDLESKEVVEKDG